MILIEEIQKGEQGSVYLGEYKGQKVAIKKLEKNKNLDWKSEMKILNKLDSQFIVKIIECKTDETFVYHIMEYISRDLYIVIQNKLSEKEAFMYLKDITKGVKYLHDINIMHRDIKPENVLVNSENKIKICDFGHSVKFKKDEKFGNIKGTMYYFAPEIVKRLEYDYRIDIWCLGIIYYEMITGYPPFYSERDSEVYRLIRKNNVIFPPIFTNKSKQNILKILQSDPNERPTLNEILEMEI